MTQRSVPIVDAHRVAIYILSAVLEHDGTQGVDVLIKGYDGVEHPPDDYKHLLRRDPAYGDIATANEYLVNEGIKLLVKAKLIAHNEDKGQVSSTSTVYEALASLLLYQYSHQPAASPVYQYSHQPAASPVDVTVSPKAPKKKRSPRPLKQLIAEGEARRTGRKKLDTFKMIWDAVKDRPGEAVDFSEVVFPDRSPFERIKEECSDVRRVQRGNLLPINTGSCLCYEPDGFPPA